MTTVTFEQLHTQVTAWDLLRALMDRLESLPTEAARVAQYADLAGEPSDYPRYQNDISHLIGRLKRVHQELGYLRRHRHDWDDQDYCAICGADGRA
jgi:hypothetical protein